MVPLILVVPYWVCVSANVTQAEPLEQQIVTNFRLFMAHYRDNKIYPSTPSMLFWGVSFCRADFSPLWSLNAEVKARLKLFRYYSSIQVWWTTSIVMPNKKSACGVIEIFRRVIAFEAEQRANKLLVYHTVSAKINGPWKRYESKALTAWSLYRNH